MPKTTAPTKVKTAKTNASKTASKPAVKASTQAKSAASKMAKSSTKAPKSLTADERQRMIELAAYHIAERDGFQTGREHDYWLQGELQIDQLIGADSGPQ